MLDCLEHFLHSTTFSVVKDFFGYKRPPPRPLSLLNQIKLLKGNHIHLNVILVGIYDPLDTPGGIARRNNISAAIQTARDIFATVQIGIARILYYDIPTDRANGHEIIDNDAEAKALTSEWTIYNDGIDVFFVRDYTSDDTLGLSAVDGPTNKNDACRMTGSVVSLEDPLSTGQTLAHELGHYLRLPHALDWGRFFTCTSEEVRPIRDCYNDQVPEFGTNLMFPVTNTGNNVDLTAAQGDGMKRHPFMRGACR
jgi:hypothetical protein